jgi:hypothetical protein
MNLNELHKHILKISEGAARERHVEQDLDAIEIKWSTWRLILHSSDLFQVPLLNEDVLVSVLADLQEEQVQLQQLHLNNLSFLSKTIESWQRKFAALEICILSLKHMQDLWVRIALYLLPNKVICTEFPISVQSFRSTKEDFISLMQSLSANPASFCLCSEVHFMIKIKTMICRLTKHQHSLSKWLQKKRQAYPRFVSYVTMNYLSTGSESPKTFMHLLSKMFEGIQSRCC